MAKTLAPAHWRNGFKKLIGPDDYDDEDQVHSAALANRDKALPSVELVTSTKHNDLGINKLRTFPTLYNGTSSPHGLPEWWAPKDEVDVLICGAGPSGLETAVSLARQGVSFRIIDKGDAPLLAGRADGVQPRFLEILHSWGLASEVAEEGPIIERTAIYKDGKKLFFGRSHQSDSRYRGLHVITQGQIERVYVRDLLRHQVLVERGHTITSFNVDESDNHEYPVQATVRSEKDGSQKTIKAKFLVGSDGAASSIRKQLDIPFEGVSTGIYWGILDCVFESDYPHAWVFGSVVSKHGGCVIIPREDGYIRLYTQIDLSRHTDLAKSQTTGDVPEGSKQESGGKVDINTITPEDVLEQANRIFAPYKLKFAAPLSWFAIWKISERVAQSFSSLDSRVHLVGDAAHVHSVMGAFGLNASIMDASNLAWKIGLCAQGAAKLDTLCETYSAERRLHACRIIRTSGEYLRFVCGSDVPLAEFDFESDSTRMNGKSVAINGTAHTNGTSTVHGISKVNGVSKANGTYVNGTSKVNGTSANGTPNTNGHPDAAHTNGVGNGDDTHDAAAQEQKDKAFLHSFFSRHSQFLLGVDAAYEPSVLAPAPLRRSVIGPRNGVRAPNPRVCLGTSTTGYLYDVMTGVNRFHIVLFLGEMLSAAAASPASDALTSVHKLGKALTSSAHFFRRYGGSARFHFVLVTKGMPWEMQRVFQQDSNLAFFARNQATLVFDDRAPDHDAHSVYEVDRAVGAAVVVRPDLWVGTSTSLDDAVESFDAYFGEFLLPWASPS